MDNGYRENEMENEEINEPKPKSRIWSVAALILSILSVVLCFLPAVSIILGLLSIALSVVSRVKIGYFDGIGLTALIVGIFGTVFGCAYIILESFILKA